MRLELELDWNDDYMLQIEYTTALCKNNAIELDEYTVWRGNTVSGNIAEYDPTMRECELIEREINRDIDKKICKIRASYDIYETEQPKYNSAYIKALNKGE